MESVLEDSERSGFFPTTRGVATLVAALAVWPAACSPGHASDAANAVPTESSTLIATSESGTEVELTFQEGVSLKVGTNRLALHVAGQIAPPAVDLLSPEMPMHGVV